jgi:hypothetical protein
MKGSPESHRVIAHEVGHSYDWYKYKMKKPSQEVIKDMKKLAGLVNPPPIKFSVWDKMTPKDKKSIPVGLKKFMTYRSNPKELFADSFSLLMYDVQMAKKKGLNFYNYIIRHDTRLKKLFTQSKLKLVTNIVKGIKKDKKYLVTERNKAKSLILKKQLTKLQNRKRIGKKTKLQITTIQNKIKELKTPKKAVVKKPVKKKVVKKVVVKKAVKKKVVEKSILYKNIPRGWKQVKGNSDWIRFENSAKKIIVELTKWRKLWGLSIREFDSRPIFNKQEVTKAVAYKLAKDYMKKSNK